MDRLYRYQRHFYDFTRKFYLLGRDALLQEMILRPNDRILEMGCGTARNLIRLAQEHPEIYLYGIDASQEMLKTANNKIHRRGLSRRITVTTALAEQVHYQKTFHLDSPFDGMFFSYSLSMIPMWKDALTNAWINLKPGGRIYIVDFWDQEKLPDWFQTLLQQWLAFFHVRHDPLLVDFLSGFRTTDGHPLHIDSIFRRYAFKTNLMKSEDRPHFLP
jgi:S-adenosylmethionine-diacylgycerolhomoserine-N-methlytransferase